MIAVQWPNVCPPYPDFLRLPLTIRSSAHQANLVHPLKPLSPPATQFFYPIAARGAWSTLLGNVTLVQGSDASSKLFDPLASTTYSPPSAFANQLSDPTKAAYLDAGAANVLLRLDAKPGIPSFAHAVGLREEDLFGTATAIFLCVSRILSLCST